MSKNYNITVTQNSKQYNLVATLRYKQYTAELVNNVNVVHVENITEVVGIQLEKGDKGDPGDNAFEVWKSQPGNENSTINDFWLFIKGNKGDKGDAGNDGNDGDDGLNGATWYTGVGVPSVGIGIDNDKYLNTATSNIYIKTAGAWALNGFLSNEIILYQNNANGATVTGTTTVTSAITPILIPANTFAVGDEIIISLMVDRLANPLASTNVGLRIGPTNVYSSSTPIGFNGQSSSGWTYPVVRSLSFKTATSFSIVNASNVITNDFATIMTTAPTNFAYDISLPYYLFVSIQPFNVADSFRVSKLMIVKRKSKTSI